MAVDKEDIDPILESAADKMHRILRAGLSFLPVGSGAAVELLNAIIMPPLERRKIKWMVDVTESLNKLEADAKIDLKKLSDNEEFITLMISASQLAIKNHAKEKIDSLRNIVLNKACGMNYDDSLQGIFVNLVDQFTPLHIKLLKIFHEGLVWSNDGRPKPNDNEMPELLLINVGSYKDLSDVNRSLIALCLKDLINNELINHWIIEKITKELPDSSFYCQVYQWGPRSHSEMLVKHGAAIKVDKKQGKYITRTSPFGNRLVDFISTPKQLKKS